MFEKEAEDSFKCKKVLYKWETDKNSYINGFKDGATFGYNKAKEEIQKIGLALQSDMNKTIEQNIQLKKQIEKMKCCQNCKKFNNLSYDCTCAEVCEEWEVKENG